MESEDPNMKLTVYRMKPGDFSSFDDLLSELTQALGLSEQPSDQSRIERMWVTAPSERSMEAIRRIASEDDEILAARDEAELDHGSIVKTFQDVINNSPFFTDLHDPTGEWTSIMNFGSHHDADGPKEPSDEPKVSSDEDLIEYQARVQEDMEADAAAYAEISDAFDGEEPTFAKGDSDAGPLNPTDPNVEYPEPEGGFLPTPAGTHMSHEDIVRVVDPDHGEDTISPPDDTLLGWDKPHPDFGFADDPGPLLRKPEEPKATGDAEATFDIKCTMKLRWVPAFLSMLEEMQQLGNMGSSRVVSLFADGDGDFRPKFKHYVNFDRVPAEIGTGDARMFDAG